MPLSHIEHYLVAADDMDATRDWYCAVLGMQEGPHPDFGFPVHWLYLDGEAVVHISPGARLALENQKAYFGRTSRNTGSATGAIDHIAFRTIADTGDSLMAGFRLLSAFAILIGMLARVPAQAQAPAFPTKVVRIVSPFPAGLTPDVIMRVVARN